MRIKEALKYGEKELKDVSDSPHIESLLILKYVLKTTKEALFSNLQYQLKKEEEKSFLKLIKKRKVKRIPLPYILGEKEFYSLKFYVDENVLIPRPESETLVDEAIKFLRNKDSANIIDIGTGSGNLIISIAKNLKNKNFAYFGVDRSIKAILVAQKNSAFHKVRVNFFAGDLFSPLKLSSKFHLIVSNPPYVSENDYKNLSFEVKKEPKSSLLSRDNGNYYTKKILQSAGKFLQKGGILLVETNLNFIRDGLYKEFEDNLKIKPFSGLDGVERFLKAIKI